MFWGVTIEPEKKYKQTVTKTFHLSMATLELNSHDKEPVSLMLDYDNQEYVLCNLQQRIPGGHPGILNCPLDLNFQAGERIAFYATGKSNVHLSGYIVDDDDLDLSEEEEEEEGDVSSKTISPKKRKESQSTSVRKKQKVEAAESSDDEEEEETNSPIKLQLKGSDEDEEDDDDDDEDDDDDDDEEEDDEEESEDENIQISSAKKAGKNQATKKNKSDQTPSKSSIPNGQTPKSEKKKQGNQTPKGTPQASSESGAQKKVLAGGVIVQDVKIGNGPVAKAGSKVAVYYVGRLKNNNKQFDSTTNGPGFVFTLGRKEVIKGWDIGVPGMKVGGKRNVTVPPAMAYGKKGLPPVIPPNSVLVFDVELRNVN